MTSKRGPRRSCGRNGQNLVADLRMSSSESTDTGRIGLTKLPDLRIVDLPGAVDLKNSPSEHRNRHTDSKTLGP